MRRPPVRLVLMLACALAGLALPSIGSARDVSPGVPDVPSLEPVKTQALWREADDRGSSSARSRRSSAARSGRSSTPPATGSASRRPSLRRRRPARSTTSRSRPSLPTRPGSAPGQAGADPGARPGVPRDRRDPPDDVAEVGRDTASTWYQAGVDARRKMATAGFDVGAGDTWAINEVTSAMRRGDGNSRANLREFLRGLYDAGGEGPPTKGVVWVVGIGQRVSGGRDLQGPYPGVAPGLGVLVGRERVRQRLVAGGLRRRPQLRRPRRVDDRPS